MRKMAARRGNLRQNRPLFFDQTRIFIIGEKKRKKREILLQNDLLDNLQKVDVEIVHEVLTGDKTTFEGSFE